MTVRILTGDARAMLATLPDASVQCCITSPPYLGLRDYGVAGQIGSEATPEAYIAALVAVFRDVWRVLRPDGVLLVNIGDSYNNFRSQKGPGQLVHGRDDLRGKPEPLSGGRGWAGLKEKDLCMMPAQVALALRADGWTLRSQMPWVKRSAMPESVNDRPTSAVEYVYLLTKGPRYFWDAEAIKREVSGNAHPRGLGLTPKSQAEGQGIKSNVSFHAAVNELVSSRNFRNTDLFYDSLEPPFGAITDAAGEIVALDVNPAALAIAHFAAFPPKLIEPLIRAGTSERGACAACGAPWVRQVDTPDFSQQPKRKSDRFDWRNGDRTSAGQAWQEWRNANPNVTTGWAPSCGCPAAEPVPCVVLDPFGGAGTVGLVADRLGRDAVLIELNPAYVRMAEARIRGDAPLFANVAAD